MKIQGLDYNTQREKLVMPEYGRDVHVMIEHCVAIENRQERQRCAETIIEVMRRMHPEVKQQPDHKRKLWDHLAIMSDFKLDIDYPFDVRDVQEVSKRPQPMAYSNGGIPVRHYGRMVFQVMDHLKTMEPGPKRDALVRSVANQMNRNLMTYGSTHLDGERIISDIARFTDGAVQLDPEEFVLERPKNVKDRQPNKKKKKK